MSLNKYEEIEETVLRLHAYLNRLYTDNNLVKIVSKIEKKGPSFLSQKDKELMSILIEYKFYEGKLFAYCYALEVDGRYEIPNLIYRLRHFKIDNRGAKVETKPNIIKNDNIGP